MDPTGMAMLEVPKGYTIKCCECIIIIIIIEIGRPPVSGHKGYNYKKYKKHIDVDFNSQAREQTHAIIQKLSTSLRNMSYFSFMTVIRIFFMFRNLKIKSILYVVF